MTITIKLNTLQTRVTALSANDAMMLDRAAAAFVDVVSMISEMGGTVPGGRFDCQITGSRYTVFDVTVITD